MWLLYTLIQLCLFQLSSPVRVVVVHVDSVVFIPTEQSCTCGCCTRPVRVVVVHVDSVVYSN